MKHTRTAIVLSTIAMLISMSAIAQNDDDHGYITVRATKVKVGHAPEYRELLGQLATSRKAAGHTGVTAWEVVRGPVSSFYLVTAADSYAEVGKPFDSGMSEGDWQRWLGRVTEVIEHSTLTTLQTHGDLAISADEDTAPNMVMLRYRTLEPGNNSNYHDWVENRLRPELREGGAKGWNISRVVIGDNTNTWVSATRVGSWEEMDGPTLLAHMSDRQRNAMLGEANEVSVSQRTELIRFIPELSY